MENTGMEKRTKQLTADQLLGQLIRGYRIDELLGYTKVTAIYRLTAVESDHADARTITVFVPPDHFSSRARERFLERFVQDATTLVALNHPHLFPVLGYGELAGTGYPYLLMPDAQVDTLAALLRRHGRLSPSFAIAVLERIAEALDYAHQQGLLHRDLSPARVIYHPQVGVQLTGLDFVHLVQLRGIEEIALPHAHLRTIAGSYLGDPCYLAPEVVEGVPPDISSDVYALGVLLYTLLCGQPPFTGKHYLDVARQHISQPLPPLHALCPEAPPALELVLQHALQRDPEQRFQSAGDLAYACMRVLHRQMFVGAAMDNTKSIFANTMASHWKPLMEATQARRTRWMRREEKDTKRNLPSNSTLGRQEGSPNTPPLTSMDNGKDAVLPSTRLGWTKAFGQLPTNGNPEAGLSLISEHPTGFIEAVRTLIADTWSELLPSGANRSLIRSRRRYRGMFPFLILLVGILIDQNVWLSHLCVRAWL